MLERLGVNTRDQITKLSTKNVAAVMVTANLPGFARPGSRIDVAISALGDASNLTGGTLLVTPLLAADGEVYAVAQGTLVTGAIAARGAAASVTKGVPTAGRFADGATVEREVALRAGGAPDDPSGAAQPRPDHGAADRGGDQRRLGAGTRARTDPRTVALDLTGRDVIASLDQIEELRVEPGHRRRRRDRRSKRHDRHGRQRADQHGGDRPGQPDHPRDRDAGGQPARAALERHDRDGAAHQHPGQRRHDKKLGILTGNVTLRDLVASLNALGVGPRDMISILQAIKAAGACRPIWRSADDRTGRRMPPQQPPAPARVRRRPQDFEAMALGELLVADVRHRRHRHGAFGGGDGEQAWRPMLIQAIAKQIAAHGGLGLAGPVLRQMMSMQEVGQ